jgi:hypothetical protein
MLVSCCSDDGGTGGIFRLVGNGQHWEVEQVFGIEVRGLCKFFGNYVVASEHVGELMVLDKDFQVVKSKQIGLGAHGLACAAGLLYYVDTMNDCIRVLNADLEEVGVIPIRSSMEECPGAYDLRHVNDIQLFDVYLIYTCFRYDLSLFRANQAVSGEERNPKNCYGLGTVAIRDISNLPHLGRMELSGLWQPHSPYYDSSQNRLYVLSSRDSRLVIVEGYKPFNSNQEIREVIIPGFLRGFWLDSDNLYIGKSFLRGEPASTCGVYVFDKNGLDQTAFIPIPANEVYAIIDEEAQG